MGSLSHYLLSILQRFTVLYVDANYHYQSKSRQIDGSDSEKKRIPPKLFDLVTRLSQSNSREVMTRIAANKAPKQRSQKLEQSLQYGQHRRGLLLFFLFFEKIREFNTKFSRLLCICVFIPNEQCLSTSKFSRRVRCQTFLLSEMAETYDSYQTLKDCRYLRLRSSEQNDTNPFDIKEIFGKKE